MELGHIVLMDSMVTQTLAVANSIWVYADTQTGKPTKISAEHIVGYELAPPYPMEYAPRKIALPTDYTVSQPFTVTQAHLDYNQHVNNGQYIRMAEAFLPLDFPVKEFRADYRKSAVLHDEIYPLISMSEQNCTILLANAEHKPYTTIQFIKA